MANSHVVIVMQDGRFLVVIYIPSYQTYMVKEDIDKVLDRYAEEYAIAREGLEGYYLPLVQLDKLPSSIVAQRN
jgi:hypothetical protein